MKPGIFYPAENWKVGIFYPVRWNFCKSSAARHPESTLTWSLRLPGVYAYLHALAPEGIGEAIAFPVRSHISDALLNSYNSITH